MSPLDAKNPPAARANMREAAGLKARGIGAPPVLKGQDGEGSVQVHQDETMKIEGAKVFSVYGKVLSEMPSRIAIQITIH